MDGLSTSLFFFLREGGRKGRKAGGKGRREIMGAGVITKEILVKQKHGFRRQLFR